MKRKPDDMSAARREKRLTASMLFNSFKGVERYSLDALQYLVAMFMRRDDVAPLWASGSAALTYWFFWTCETAEGWRASPEQVNDAERFESSNWLRTNPNPLLWAREHGGVRQVVLRDIHFAGTPVKILRVAYGVVKEDAEEMERIGCRLTKRTIGFAGNRKDALAYIDDTHAPVSDTVVPFITEKKKRRKKKKKKDVVVVVVYSRYVNFFGRKEEEEGEREGEKREGERKKERGGKKERERRRERDGR